jgi:O-antigen/teichoic acid export membrane protein
MSTPYSGSQTRRNLAAFLAGKVPTAVLTACILGLSARLLPAAEFGHYVVAMALVELVLGLSSFGLDWILLRFIPDVRLHGDRRSLARLVGGVAVCRTLLLAAIAAVALALPALRPASVPAALASPLAMLLVVEGSMRVLRDNTLEALALQSRMQAVTVLRGAVLLLVLLAADSAGGASARTLLLAELAASGGALLLAAGCFLAALLRQPAVAQPGWQAPRAAQMRAVALHNYVSSIVEYLYSPSSLILLLARSQAPQTMAGLGFALRLTDIIRNYLPGMVVFSVVRARMLGAYAGSRDYGELQRWAHFVFKVCALSLLPVLAVAIVYGDLVLQLASGGRFGEYRLLFAVLCGWLVLRLHRLILNIVCNAVGLMGMWALASLVSLLALPLLAWLGGPLLGLWLVPAALLGNELVVNGLVVAGMARRGFAWPLGWRWWRRALPALALALAAPSLLAWLVPGQGAAAALLGSLLLCAVFAAALLLLGVFDVMDRKLINRVLGRQWLREAI